MVGLVALALTHPQAATACPVCFSAASEQTRLAYYWTAALMTLLPLAIVGAIGGWLYHRGSRRRESELPVSEVTQ